MSDNFKIRDHRALVDISFLLGPKSIKTEAKRLTLTVEKKGSSASFVSDSPPLWCAPCLMGQFPYLTSGLGREPQGLHWGQCSRIRRNVVFPRNRFIQKTGDEMRTPVNEDRGDNHPQM